MVGAIKTTLVRTRWYLLVLTVLYVLCIAGGTLTGVASRSTSISTGGVADRHDSRQSDQLESLFGPFRQPLREGAIGTMLLVMAIVFAINLVATVPQFFLPGMLIVPLALTLLVGGWMQGVFIASLHASSLLSLVLFLAMGALEWVTYILASAAGLNVGMSFLSPATQHVSSRWKAFKRAFADAGRIYALIVLILTAQAVFEGLYVRKVLLMGGTGIPLTPY